MRKSFAHKIRVNSASNIGLQNLKIPVTQRLTIITNFPNFEKNEEWMEKIYIWWISIKNKYFLKVLILILQKTKLIKTLWNDEHWQMRSTF